MTAAAIASAIPSTGGDAEVVTIERTPVRRTRRGLDAHSQSRSRPTTSASLVFHFDRDGISRPWTAALATRMSS